MTGSSKSNLHLMEEVVGVISRAPASLLAKEMKECSNVFCTFTAKLIT